MSDFDKKAAEWDEDPKKVILANAIAECIVSMVPIHKDMKVLDFGCGTGLVTMQLAQRVKSVSAFDNSKGMLDILSQKIEQSGIINIFPHYIDSYTDIPSDQKYDMIISSMVLHHIVDYETLLNNFYNLLESNGNIAIADLEEEDGSFHRSDINIAHNGFNIIDLKSILEKAGFKEIQNRKVFDMSRIQDDGSERTYPVFLITGKKI